MWNATWVDLLKHDLLANYDRVVKPTGNAPINVTVELTITHLDVNEETGFLNVWGWISFVWYDNKLKWNPSNYGNLTQFVGAQHEIWQPDITLYNSATVDAFDKYGNNLILVYNNGLVLWVPQIKLNVFCSLNLRMWPFDTQQCSLIFGSWVYDGLEITTTLKQTKYIPGIEIDMFIENHEWLIKNISSSVEVKMYECCEEPYMRIVYNITIQRRSPMFRAVVISPAVALTLMILAVFWLPPLCGEKIILNCFIFLALMMFIIYFTMKISIFAFHTPLIVIYYTSSLLLVGFSIIISVFVLCLSKIRHEQKIPVFIGNLLRGNVGRFLGVSIVERKNRNHTEMQEKLSSSYNNKAIDDNFLITSHSIQYDWILLATAIDRIAFICYCLVFLILSLSCYMI